jgi:uncharacterized protein (DUF39 family)
MSNWLIGISLGHELKIRGTNGLRMTGLVIGAGHRSSLVQPTMKFRGDLTQAI